MMMMMDLIHRTLITISFSFWLHVHSLGEVEGYNLRGGLELARMSRERRGYVCAVLIGITYLHLFLVISARM
jgi:hypothetical protein